MFIARKSKHIQQDIERNWSSWNFAEEGLNATPDEIENWKKEAIENDRPFHISGFELWGEEIKNADIRELYDGYWVLVDTRNYGIYGIELEATTFDEAIVEANRRDDYFGDGICFDAQSAKLVYSNNDIHVFEVEIQ